MARRRGRRHQVGRKRRGEPPVELPRPLTETIINAYRTVGHPVALSAPGRVAKYFNVNTEQAKHALQQIDSYTTHREYKRPRYFNPYYIYDPTFFQCDLMEVRPLARYNSGVNYLCLIICVFSRKIWVYPMKTKSGEAMAAVLERWFDELPLHVKVETWMSDKGKEFINAHVARVLQSRGVAHQLALGTSKAAYAERAQKSFQRLLYTYLSDRETLHYLDVLDKLVQTYNTRAHRSLDGMTPNEAFSRKNRRHVRGLHMARYAKVPWQKPKLKVGDIVRVKAAPTSKVATATRSYVQQFKPEYFVITRVNKKLKIPMYTLRSMDTDEDIIGQFYAAELSKVGSDVFKVEKIIRWRGKRPNRQALVKWAHFGDQHNSWISERDIVEQF